MPACVHCLLSRAQFEIFDEDDKLKTCKKSIQGIIKDHCTAADGVGLVTFADTVEVDLPFEIKGDEGKEQMKLDKVNKLKTRGETAFYSGVLEGIKTICAQKDDDYDFRIRAKWVVALTDGVDNKSKPDDFEAAKKLLKEEPCLNFALSAR